MLNHVDFQLALQKDYNFSRDVLEKQTACPPKDESQKTVAFLGGLASYIGTTPHPVTVTTRIVPCLVGNHYKPSFVTGILGGGVNMDFWESSMD